MLFIILNQGKDVKKIMTILKQYEAQATIMDTIGAASFYESQEMHDTIIAGTRQSLEQGKKQNKTIFTILPTEETLELVMDQIGEVLGFNSYEVGRGFMFAVPVYNQRGIKG